MSAMIGKFLAFAAIPAFVLASVLFAFSRPAWSQDYPARPVRLIVPSPPGGSSDILARLIAQHLGMIWPHPVVVDNRPGASTIIASEITAKSAPDGHTLYLASEVAMSVNPSLYTNLPYDWKRSFAPITLAATLNQVMVVTPSLAARNMQELIALAKKNPGQLTYASNGVGGSPFLATELFKWQAGIDVLHVPYKGAAQALTALYAGDVSLFMLGEAAAAPAVKAGRVRAIATSSKKRSAIYPETPTIAESGLPEFEYEIWFGIFAAANTPEALVQKINADWARVIDTRELRSALATQGFDPRASTAEELRSRVQRDYERWAALIGRIGVKPQ